MSRGEVLANLEAASTMPAVIATPCWSNIYSCPPHNYSLDALVEHTQLSYEVFTVATPEFMQQWWPQLSLTESHKGQNSFEFLPCNV